MKASELVRLLRHHDQSRVVELDLMRVRCGQAADLLEYQAKAIEEMREALEAAAHILPRYQTKGNTAGDDEECFAVIETVNEALASHSKEGEQG